MNQHTVKAYGDELNQLTAEVVRMGGLAEAQVADAIESVARRDVALAKAVVERDNRLDALHRDIEKKAIRLIALRQPVASDLRRTLGAMKLASDLERTGDLAKNIAKRTHVLSQMPPIDGAGLALRRMSNAVGKMVQDALDSYIRRDAALAEDVRQRDLEVDQMYNALFREFLTHMMEDPRNITACMHLHFIAKNVERMGDLATAIAEQVIYLVTGDLPDDSRPKDNRVPDLGADLPTGR